MPGPGWRVRWTPSAFRDLENAYEYLRQRDAAAARRFAASVRDAVRRVSEHPESGRVLEDIEPAGTYRHVVVPPYRIIYWLPEPGIIVVTRVWDGRRDPATLKV